MQPAAARWLLLRMALGAWPRYAALCLYSGPTPSRRERAGKAYRVLPYYVARFICDMPLRVAQGLLFGEECMQMFACRGHASGTPASGRFLPGVAACILVAAAACI